jgi:haloacetate dehalogenase
MKRRKFLGGVTAASFGVLFGEPFTQPARAQTGAHLAGQDSFESSHVEVSGNTVFVRHYGKGPAILMVHGFPRTSLMW